MQRRKGWTLTTEDGSHDHSQCECAQVWINGKRLSLWPRVDLAGNELRDHLGVRQHHASVKSRQDCITPTHMLFPLAQHKCFFAEQRYHDLLARSGAQEAWRCGEDGANLTWV